jgi:putative ABC transport system substrate-binding protein
MEGQQIALEYRYAENLDQLPPLAAELVRLPVALILARGTPSALAAQHATTTIPIVFVDVANPVRRGLVPSLARSGGNSIGIASEGHPDGGAGLIGKQLELLKEAVPTVSRVAMLLGQVGLPTSGAGEQARERAAPVLGLMLRHFYVERSEDFTAWVFPAITADAPAIDTLYARGPLMFEARRQLADFALQYRLPMMGSIREHAEAGSPLAYGPHAAADPPLPGRRGDSLSCDTWCLHDERCLQMKPVTSVERIRGHITVTHASGNDIVCESEAEHEVDRSAKEGVMAVWLTIELPASEIGETGYLRDIDYLQLPASHVKVIALEADGTWIDVREWSALEAPPPYQRARVQVSLEPGPTPLTARNVVTLAKGAQAMLDNFGAAAGR